MTQQIRNAAAILKLFNDNGVDLRRTRAGYWKFKADGYMDLSVDLLYRNEDGREAVRISMAHNGKQNGDVMADPDMEITIFFDGDQPTALARSYQNDYVGVYQSTDRGNVTQEHLDSFLATWLRNIAEQGHKLHA